MRLAVPLLVALTACGPVETSELSSTTCVDAATAERIASSTETGLLVGAIAAPSGAVPVSGALVEVTGADQQATASGAGGCFELELPYGAYEIAVEKGRYAATASSDVLAGQVIDLGTVPLDAGDLAIAVVYGDYDDVGELLVDLGLDTDLFMAPDDLYGDPQVLGAYDAVFANCGSAASTRNDTAYTEAQTAHVEAWIEAGGTLYASDWEVELFAAAVPDAVVLEDPVLDGPVGTVAATLHDRNIQALVGSDTTDIHFELPGWALVDRTLDATPMVTAEVDGQERPLAVMHWPGEGRAVFTSFHNSEQLSDAMRAILYELLLVL